MKTENIEILKSNNWTKLDDITDNVSLENSNVYSAVEVVISSATPTTQVGHSLDAGVPLAINNIDGAGVYVRSLNDDCVLVVTK